MSEYTPTTGEVIEAWVAHNTPDLPTGFDLVAAYDSFNLWLAEHDAALVEKLAGEWPMLTRDMVSRGSVGDWLRARAAELREGTK